jgi:hypothetical protein
MGPAAFSNLGVVLFMFLVPKQIDSQSVHPARRLHTCTMVKDHAAPDYARNSKRQVDEPGGLSTNLNLFDSDLMNLMGIIDIPTIMVDTDGRIRRFTPAARKILNLSSDDVGRPVGNIQHGFGQLELGKLVSEVVGLLALALLR